MRNELRQPQPSQAPKPSQRPAIGDRIALRLPRLGVYPRGTVQYADDFQILVKWDDGRSESLRPTYADHFRVVEDE